MVSGGQAEKATWWRNAEQVRNLEACAGVSSICPSSSTLHPALGPRRLTPQVVACGLSCLLASFLGLCSGMC